MMIDQGFSLYFPPDTLKMARETHQVSIAPVKSIHLASLERGDIAPSATSIRQHQLRYQNGTAKRMPQDPNYPHIVWTIVAAPYCVG